MKGDKHGRIERCGVCLCVQPSRLLRDERTHTTVGSGGSNAGSERGVWRKTDVAVMIS